MDAERAIYTRLSTYKGVSALVGGRIYPLILPQNPVLPAITYQRISGPRAHAKDGPAGLAHPRFQVSCWAETYSGVKQLAEQVRLALDGYSATVGGLEIYYTEVQTDMDIFEDRPGTYRVLLEVVLWHRED